MTKPQGRYELRATVLQDGHIDRITGPRCMLKMDEGPQFGLYLIAHTPAVLSGGTDVFYDTITRQARAAITKATPEDGS